MALRAIDLATHDEPAVPGPTATIHAFAPTPRMVTLGVLRRERRRWIAVGTLLVAAPFAACIGVLEVVR
jgi:hypothetical protein